MRGKMGYESIRKHLVSVGERAGAESHVQTSERERGKRRHRSAIIPTGLADILEGRKLFLGYELHQCRVGPQSLYVGTCTDDCFSMRPH